MSSILLISSLYANDLDKKILKFENKRVSKNPQLKVKDIKIFYKKKLDNGWIGYIFDIKVNIKGKDIKAKDTIFTDGNIIAPDLIGFNTKSLKKLLIPPLGKKYFNKSHLIAGTHGAKNTIVLFSDPLCPFCLDLVPDVIRYVKKYPKNIALYYYNFPLLRLHPASGALSLIEKIAHKKGLKDATLKIYEADFEEYFKISQTDEKIILKAANKVLGLNITLDELKKESFKKDVQLGEDAMVQGTPTMFINGVMDDTREAYKRLR
jgi:protein-disulfide isomerase